MWNSTLLKYSTLAGILQEVHVEFRQRDGRQHWQGSVSKVLVDSFQRSLLQCSISAQLRTLCRTFKA
jgi:hypothetical protein